MKHHWGVISSSAQLYKEMTDGRAHIQTFIDGLSVQFLMLNPSVGAPFFLHPPVVITLSNNITISLHLVLDDHFAGVYKDCLVTQVTQ